MNKSREIHRLHEQHITHMTLHTHNIVLGFHVTERHPCLTPIVMSQAAVAITRMTNNNPGSPRAANEKPSLLALDKNA